MTIRVKDVLSGARLSVAPTASIEDAIDLMLAHRVGGLPVVDAADRLCGIVTEGDLLRRVELGTEYKHSLWAALLTSPGHLAEEYSRSRGRHVGDVMTRELVTIQADAPLADAVSLMMSRKIKRLPVLDDTRLVGTLSRADILNVLKRELHVEHPRSQTADDGSLVANVQGAIVDLPFATDLISVSVHEDVATLSGTVDDERERTAILVAVQNVPGIRIVRDELAWLDPLLLAAAS